MEVEVERGRRLAGVEGVAGVGRLRVFGRRSGARVAGTAGGGRGLGADDGRGTVNFTKVCERDGKVHDWVFVSPLLCRV